MDLKFYPFDLQVCPIHVESYSYREEQLDIKWHSNVTIQVSDDLTLPTFSLVSNLIRTMSYLFSWLSIMYLININSMSGMTARGNILLEISLALKDSLYLEDI